MRQKLKYQNLTDDQFQDLKEKHLKDGVSKFMAFCRDSGSFLISKKGKVLDKWEVFSECESFDKIKRGETPYEIEGVFKMPEKY